MAPRSRIPCDDDLIAMIAAGRLPLEIAKAHRVGCNSVYAALRRIASERPDKFQWPPRLPLPSDDDLIAMIEAGRRPVDIARECGVPHQSVYRYLDRIEASQPGSIKRQRNIRWGLAAGDVQAIAATESVTPPTCARAIQRKARRGPKPVRTTEDAGPPGFKFWMIVDGTEDADASVRNAAIIVGLVKGGVDVRLATHVVEGLPA